jgi:uncharacterized protein YndB with AHSA1/START domain
MNLDLSFEEHFPHPIERLWQALTDATTLAAWLMENDFEAKLGKRFTLRCSPPGGVSELIEAEVIELDPPHRMVWSWRDAGRNNEVSRVSFDLCAEGSGTRLVLRHSGDSEDEQGGRLGRGWPVKLQTLRSALLGTAPASIPR